MDDGTDMTKRHILIVDSEPVVASLMSEALKRSNPNYCVRAVHSGEEALQVLHNSPVDLLVADLHTPGISGLDLIHWTRICNSHTRAILTIACGDDEIAAKIRRLQVSGCLCKPFHIEELRGVVQHVLAV
jgi:DNA-binding response OmpR family regulator